MATFRVNRFEPGTSRITDYVEKVHEGLPLDDLPDLEDEVDFSHGRHLYPSVTVKKRRNYRDPVTCATTHVLIEMKTYAANLMAYLRTQGWDSQNPS